MDFDDLLLLLLLSLPVLSRLFKKKPAPGLPPDGEPLPPHASDGRPPDALQEALRQIREALAEKPTAEPPVPELAARPPTPVPAPRLVRAREFQEVGAFEHDAHGFGPGNPLSEETFERRPALGAPLTPRRRTPRVVKALPKNPHATVAHSLLTAKGLREAFILKEVLGPPISKRRD